MEKNGTGTKSVIVIAPDKFKGSLSASEVAQAIERGIKHATPSAITQKFPMADGGEGTMGVLVEATKGKIAHYKTYDALMRPITARYGVLGDNETAVVEMASAAGLELLKPEERNPLYTTTYGVGHLLKKIIHHGYKKILVCIGGSATNDGGAGMLQALGCRLLDVSGKDVPPGGASLLALRTVDTTVLKKILQGVQITVACDVSNPLCGENGATYVFAPQKGAAATDLPRLDAALENLANLSTSLLGKNFSTYPGAGAAGGLGFALLAFCKAQLQSGVELVSCAVGLPQAIANATLVITGEGSLDVQTVNGKVPSGVIKIAKEYNVPVIALCGRKSGDLQPLYDMGLKAAYAISDKASSIDDSMSNAAKLLEQLAYEIIKELQE